MIAPLNFFLVPKETSTKRKAERINKGVHDLQERIPWGREFVQMKEKRLWKEGSLGFQFPQIIPFLQFGTYLGSKHKHSCTSNRILPVPLLVFSVPTNKLTQSWIVIHMSKLELSQVKFFLSLCARRK